MHETDACRVGNTFGKELLTRSRHALIPSVMKFFSPAPAFPKSDEGGGSRLVLSFHCA